MFRRALAVLTTAALTYVIVPTPPGDRIVRVYGDLRTAEHVAVIVPGSDTRAATFDGGRAKPYSTPGGGAKAVLAEARALDFGADPADPVFGSRLFAAGAGGHSDYFQPGGESLRNLTLIALGRTGEVSRG
ncbi:alpha/beta hydrolase [Streptosporangium sp. CA-135522]|uniref:alpha/beta hydrolase n=1 Tax=Streptosporangium sp. CA-135522 TaxID=3240072 RepID=UPI003D90E43E